MALNVHDQIADTKPSLVKRMTENQEIAGVIMAYLNLFVGLAVRQNRPVEGVSIDPLQEASPGVFRAKINFSPVSNPIAPMWAPQSDFSKYAHAKANHMAMALKKNPTLERWFGQMIDVLDNWARHRGIPFSHIVIEDPIVTKAEYILTFKVKRKPLLA